MLNVNFHLGEFLALHRKLWWCLHHDKISYVRAIRSLVATLPINTPIILVARSSKFFFLHGSWFRTHNLNLLMSVYPLTISEELDGKPKLNYLFLDIELTLTVSNFAGLFLRNLNFAISNRCTFFFGDFTYVIFNSWLLNTTGLSANWLFLDKISNII